MSLGMLGGCGVGSCAGEGRRRAVSSSCRMTRNSASRQNIALAVALNLGFAHSECRLESICAVATYLPTIPWTCTGGGFARVSLVIADEHDDEYLLTATVRQ